MTLAEADHQRKLDSAITLCKLTGANLHAITVVPDFGMNAISPYFPNDYKRDALNKTLVQLRDFVRTRVPAEINVRHIVAEGSVYDVIIKTAVQINAEAIVMDASRPQQLNYLLSPNVARVVRHATCSVLLVRE